MGIGRRVFETDGSNGGHRASIKANDIASITGTPKVLSL
jgi:hypothetical protein